MSLKDSNPNKKLVYNSKAELLADLDIIEARMNFPIVGVNQKTGQPAPDKCLTTQWIDRDELTVDQDGKWRMRKPNNSYMANINAPIDPPGL